MGGQFGSKEEKTFNVVSSTDSPVAPPSTTPPVASPTTSAPISPTSPTLYPTHTPPTMYPTQSVPTIKPTIACKAKGESCNINADCCMNKCNTKKKVCRSKKTYTLSFSCCSIKIFRALYD